MINWELEKVAELKGNLGLYDESIKILEKNLGKIIVKKKKMKEQSQDNFEN